MKSQVKVSMGTESAENHRIGSKLFNIVKGNHLKTGSYPTDNTVHRSRKINEILEIKCAEALLHVQRQLMLK